MIGDALRLIRVIHDVKAKDLAKELSISPSYLSEIEKGKKKPTLDILEKYSEYFELRPSTLLFFSEELDSNNIHGKTKSNMRSIIIKLMKGIENKKC